MPIEQRVVASTGYRPNADEELFRKCQALGEERGRHRRGIPRARDLAKYPLSTRIIDITPHCGETLYGRTESGKPKYECSRYRNSGGRECARNVVDGEGALRFVLDVLRQRTVQCGGRAKLRERLMKIAATRQTKGVSHGAQQWALLHQRVDQVKRELETIEGNMALAGSETAFRAIENQFEQTRADLERLRASLNRLPPTSDPLKAASAIDAEVDAAMVLFDDLGRVSDDANARPQIAAVLKRLDLELGLRFMDNPRGKRPKRLVQGGMVTIGPRQNLSSAKNCNGDHPSDADDGDRGSESRSVGETPPTTEMRQREGQSFRKERAGKPAVPLYAGTCVTVHSAIRSHPLMAKPKMAYDGWL